MPYKNKTQINWRLMMRRCYETTNQAFNRYGGKGIDVIERWHSFENFWEDMGECPQGMTLDRIDGQKGYSLENCRWATRREQVLNRDCTRQLMIDGKPYALADVALAFNLKRNTLWRRIYVYNWDVDRAINTIAKRGFNGKVSNG